MDANTSQDLACHRLPPTWSWNRESVSDRLSLSGQRTGQELRLTRLALAVTKTLALWRHLRSLADPRSELEAAESRFAPFGRVRTSWHRHGAGKGSRLCPVLQALCASDIWTTRRWKLACGSVGLQLCRTFAQRARTTDTEANFATCGVRRIRSATFAARSLYICGYEVTLCMRDVDVELQAHARSRH